MTSILLSVFLTVRFDSIRYGYILQIQNQHHQTHINLHVQLHQNATFIRLVHLDGCRDVIAGDVVTTSIVELEHVNRSRLVLTDRRFAGGCVRHDVIVIVARRFHDICKQDICVVRCAAVLKRQSLLTRNRIEPARYNVKSIFVTKFQPMILSLIMDPHNLTISMATTRCTYVSFHRISQ